MLRKLFIFVLCFVATISASQAQTIPNNEIWYTTTSGKIAELVIGSEPMIENGSDFKIISHTYENGKGIIRANKAIKAYGYEECEGDEVGFIIDGDIKSVTLPKSLTSIGMGAFSGCSSLTSITIPDSVTTITGGAFDGCGNLPVIDNIRYADTYLVEVVDKSQTSYTVKEGARFIGNYAFYGCSSLRSVTIPDSVTTIGGGAFFGCSSLTSVTIPDSVTTIGWEAFYGCSSLTSVTIPDSVTTIVSRAFYNCSSLRSVTIPDSLTTIGEYAFYGCVNLPVIDNIRYADTYLVEVIDKSQTSYTVKEGARFIGNYAFNDCSSLTSVTIPDSVTSIGEGAFYNCSSLTSVTIPDSVTSIGESAFNDCSSLTSVTIGDSVTSIGYLAFFCCSSLTSVTIPDSVTTIGDDAFYGCSSLRRVTIGDSVTTIGAGAFSGCSSLRSVTIPDSVTTIGGEAFSGCSGLRSVTIPDSVTTIEYAAFKDCSSLRSITIPDSITSIGEGAFGGCNIQSVTIDMVTGDVSYIKEMFGADKITEYTSKYFSADRCCLIKDGVLIKFLATERNEYSIPNSVTSIGEGAFLGCSNLRSITISDCVTSIGEGAFGGCNIQSVTIDVVTGDVSYIAKKFGANKIAGYTGKYASADGLCIIKDGTLLDFLYKGQSEYSIPNSVTSVGEGAFSGCSNLRSITIPDCVTSIGERAFSGCSNLRSITIPDCVTTIGEGAFDGCNIQSVTIDVVTGDVSYIAKKFGVNKIAGYIGKYASADGLCIIKDGVLLDFLYKGQSEYSIPDGVTTIEKEMFKDCNNLTTITIPDSVAEIGNGAFSGCSSLAEVVCLASTPPAIDDICVSEIMLIYVPKEYVKVYKKDPKWSIYKKHIKPIK